MRRSLLVVTVAGAVLLLGASGAFGGDDSSELVSPGLVNLDVKDTALAEVLAILAEMAGKRLAVEAGVALDSAVTIQAKEVEWQELLQRLLRVSNLTYEEADGWLIVSTRG